MSHAPVSPEDSPRPVLEMRPALQAMFSSNRPAVLVDEQGRIAAINRPWLLRARTATGSPARFGRGADFLGLCKPGGSVGPEVELAVRAVLDGATRSTITRGNCFAGRLGAIDAVTIERVRGPLENWALVTFDAAVSRRKQIQDREHALLPELGIAIDRRTSFEELCERLNTCPAHAVVLDTSGVIVAVNVAWNEFAVARGATPRSCGIGIDYLEICDAAVRSGEPRASRFAEGLRTVLEGHKPTWWLDAPCEIDGEPRPYRGRATHVPTADGYFVVVTHAERAVDVAVRAVA